ncbi:MAG: energy-coupling factor ABC transporter ATP-binding protein [Lachnospirales bacterium]
MLSIENLSYKYDDSYALKNINLNINNGEKVAILGNNGAGKTTLFKCITNILHHYEGKILGNENTGLVFQEPDVQIIGSTVEKEISFGPMNLLRDKKKVKAMVDYAIDEMDLNTLRNRPTHYLSGGEKKRVCIADVLAMESKTLIFDEPTAYLDPLNSALLEYKLSELNKNGSTIILSTHDVDFAYRFANRFIIMSKGNIIADGGIEIFSDNNILKGANLVKPILFSVMEMYNYKDLDKYPRTIEKFKEYVNEKGNFSS